MTRQRTKTKELLEIVTLIVCINVLLFLVFFEFFPQNLYAQSSQPSKAGDALDWKFLMQMLALVGSLVAFAFYNGSRLGKLEEKIESLKNEVSKQFKDFSDWKKDCSDCKRENSEARKELWKELNSTREKLVRVEMRSLANALKDENKELLLAKQESDR